MKLHILPLLAHVALLGAVVLFCLIWAWFLLSGHLRTVRRDRAHRARRWW